MILIDLPGFGLSSRPNFRSKKQDGWWVDTTGDDIEHFYAAILEKWFIKMGIQQCVLLGKWSLNWITVVVFFILAYCKELIIKTILIYIFL